MYEYIPPTNWQSENDRRAIDRVNQQKGDKRQTSVHVCTCYEHLAANIDCSTQLSILYQTLCAPGSF